MADRGFPAPHDGFCDLCSKPIAAGDRVCLLDWSEWAHKTCVDARPVPIPLPPEPSHDRVIEALDADGRVCKRFTRVQKYWVCELGAG